MVFAMVGTPFHWADQSGVPLVPVQALQSASEFGFESLSLGKDVDGLHKTASTSPKAQWRFFSLQEFVQWQQQPSHSRVGRCMKDEPTQKFLRRNG
jgi:hypothetical protein